MTCALDLFAGAGGWSLGAEQAGARVVGAVPCVALTVPSTGRLVVVVPERDDPERTVRDLTRVWRRTAGRGGKA